MSIRNDCIQTFYLLQSLEIPTCHTWGFVIVRVYLHVLLLCYSMNTFIGISNFYLFFLLIIIIEQKFSYVIQWNIHVCVIPGEITYKKTRSFFHHMTLILVKFLYGTERLHTGINLVQLRQLLRLALSKCVITHYAIVISISYNCIYIYIYICIYIYLVTPR